MDSKEKTVSFEDKIRELETIVKELESGEVNLDEELTYTGAYYNTGSGVLKNKPINTGAIVFKVVKTICFICNSWHNLIIK